MAQDFKGDLFFKLNSNDKQQVKLSSELAFNSSVIHDRFLNQFPSTELVIGDLVSDYEILDKVIKYIRKHKENVKLDEPKNTSLNDIDNLDNALAEELKLVNNFKMLFNLSAAAYNLNLTSLMNLTCKCIAHSLDNKTPEQIREQFSIQNDYKPDEEEEIRKENQWCEKQPNTDDSQIE